MTFEKLGLSPKTMKAINEMGFSSPSPIQREAIPLLAQGVDLVAQAQTGSGKTAAFGIHIIEKMNPNMKHVQSLILAPTRELAVQVANEIKKLSKYHNLSVATVYGGASINVQSDILRKGPQIVVGTPGRVIDMIKRGSLRLDRVSIVVLDEADRMLDMGFIDDVKFIISNTPRTRQTLLFSATMPEEIKLLAKEYMNHPEGINVSTDAVPIDKIQQSYITVNRKEKFSELLKILEKENPKLCIIFVKTKFGADRLGHMLQRNGKNNITLHGDLSQSKREKALSMFKNKHIHILVATDIAARGIDVSGITHVINYDIPIDPNNYAHRIGRTARAGSEGKAITLVSPEELYEFKMMQRKIGIFINEEKEGVIINNPETDEYSLEDRLTGFEQQHKTSKSSFKAHSNQRFKKHNWHKPINNYRHKK